MHKPGSMVVGVGRAIGRARLPQARLGLSTTGRSRALASLAGSAGTPAAGSAADSFDFVVAGAGIMGLNIAYQIRRRLPEARVVVLEKGSGLGEGSTGSSSAVLRSLYTLDPMMETARDGLRAYRNWHEYLREPREALTAHLIPMPQLWLMGKTREAVQRDQERLASYGVESSVMTPDDVLARWQGRVNPCNRPFDFHGEVDHECGPVGPDSDVADGEDTFLCEETAYFEPVSALVDLQAACAREGIETRLRSHATSVLQAGGRVTGVGLQGGGIIKTGNLINAAGPWCNQLNDAAGLARPLPLSMRPTRIAVLYKEAPDLVHADGALVPGFGDTRSGTYSRPQMRSRQILISTVREEDEQEVVDPSDFNAACDPEMRQAFLNALHHRLPTLDTRGRVTSFSALYTICHDDVHPQISDTSLDGFYVANGFSGHGFKCGPAVGSLMARVATGVTLADEDPFECGVDPSFFSAYRVPHKLPFLNVLA